MMKEKKNIDRLFQEKFKDFEAQPTGRVWENIVATQKKDRDSRKVIPLWWKLGGIAAALAFLIAFGTFIFESDTATISAPSVVTDDSVKTESSEQKMIVGEQPDNELVSSKTNQVKVQESTVVSKKLMLDKEAAIAGKNSNPKNNPTTSINPPGKFSKDSKGYAAITTSFDKPQVKGNGEKESNSLNQYQYKQPPVSTEIMQTATVGINKTKTEITDPNLVSRQKDIIKEKDLVAEADKIAFHQNEEVRLPKEKTVRDRWDVGAVAAPVYYGDFGGSGLDPQFKDNNKTGDVNLSYGVQVSYALTPRLKVRTGVSNVDLSYSTNDLAFSTNGGIGRQLQGVDYSQNGSAISIADASNRNELVSDGLLIGAANDISTGSVQQRLNYIEVPVEAVYTISDKRLGVSVIGGVSTLVLNDNEVLLRSDDLNTSLGKSSSVKNVSFTTNIGLGLDYKITEDFKFNLEPALKYQINGYDDSVGEFKPYYLGVYTGFSYKF